jgi:hypothetical protein
VSNIQIPKVRVLKKREFIPHHILIGVADIALEMQKLKRPAVATVN